MTAGTAYKVLADGQSSHHGGSGKWRKGKWRTVKGDLVPCSNGLHYCRPDQLIKWLGPQIWVFEDGSPDETIDHGDKMVTRKGRIVEKVEAWTPEVAQKVCYAIADRAIRSATDALTAAGVDASSLMALSPITDEASAWAASYAAEAASYAAEAASNAAEAASYAAEAASYAAEAASNAAGAASYAAWAASYAAGAASYAAWAASYAAGAASNAAEAAGYAAVAASYAASTGILFEFLSGVRS